MNLHISWGVRVSALYITFAVSMLVMVWNTFGHKNELVVENYYDQEVHYNEQMEKTRRANALPVSLKWEIRNGELRLIFPDYPAQGDMHFLRPSDKTADVVSTVSAGTDSVAAIPLQRFQKGMYRLKADWSAHGETYFSEHIVVIP